MKKLITKFETKLKVSRLEAEIRVILFLFFTFCFFSTIFIYFFTFPYRNNPSTIKVSLPADSYQITKFMPKDPVLVNEHQFKKIRKTEDPIYIYVREEGIFNFLTFSNGTPFFFEKRIIFPGFYYKIKNPEIKNGFLFWEKSKDIDNVRISVPVVIFILFIFLMLIFSDVVYEILRAD